MERRPDKLAPETHSRPNATIPDEPESNKKQLRSPHHENKTIQLSPKLMATLFDVDIRTINEHRKTSLRRVNSMPI